MRACVLVCVSCVRVVCRVCVLCFVCMCCVVEVENAYISACVKLKIVLCFGDLLVTSA